MGIPICFSLAAFKIQGGKVKSKKVYKGPMNKDNSQGIIECGRWAVGRAGESNGGNGDNCN